MEIKRQYLQKYLHKIAMEQVISEYTEKGYDVKTKEKIGNFEADIIARKNSETLIIEIKTGRLSNQRKEKISGIADYIRTQENYKLIIIVATPPKEKKLEITEIEQLLSDYFLDNTPDDLDTLSTHTRLECVSDVDIDEISIEGKYIAAKGSGAFEVELQFGSDSDQNNDLGHKTGDSIPFYFDILLEYNDFKKLIVSEITTLKIDINSYFGES